MSTEAQIQQGVSVLKIIADIVIEAIQASPQGAPGGHLYAALMSTGMTLEQFERLINLLVETGKVTKRGQLYFAGSNS
jgi:hypothetical protein